MNMDSLKNKIKILFVLFILAISGANASITLPALFSDGVVLQQNTEVSVWGWSSKGRIISVTPSWNNQTYTATADTEGYWRTKIATTVGGNTSYSITISDNGGNTKKVNDVLIGEVWLCSGQSNMEMLVREANNSNEEAKDANYPYIKIFKVPFNASFNPQKDIVAKWVSPTPETILNSYFGAIPFFFSRDLYKSLNIPIGIIHAAKGSANQETWLSEDNIVGAEYAENVLKEAREGNMPEREQHVATLLYNGMFKPLVPYTVKGVCWYQGERNHVQPEEYKLLLDNFINSWREELEQPEMPFLITQLSGYSGYSNDGWTSVQETQYNISQKYSNIFTVMSYDVGDSLNVHPTNKQDVSYRLCLAARKMVYGENILAQGPSVKNITINGSTIGLSYKDVGNGLVIKDGFTKINNFMLAGSDNTFYNADAVIVGTDSITVSCSKVPAPKYIRYAYKNYNSDVNLYNSGGLPAVPFRTDATRMLISTQSGDWYDASTWGGIGVPGKNDNVTITNGHTVTNYVDKATTKDLCKALTVEGNLFIASTNKSYNYITNVYGPVICNGTIDLGSGLRGAYLTFKDKAGLSGTGSANLGGLTLASAYTNCIISLPSVVLNSSLTITTSASKIIIDSNTNISGYAFSPSSSAGQQDNYGYYDVYGKATFNYVYLCNSFSGTAKAKINIKEGGELKATTDITPMRNGSSIKGIGGSGCVFSVEEGAELNYPTTKDPVQYTESTNSNYDKNLVIHYYKGSIINGKVKDSEEISSITDVTDIDSIVYYDCLNKNLVFVYPVKSLRIYNTVGLQTFSSENPSQIITLPETCKDVCIVQIMNQDDEIQSLKILVPSN